MAVVVGDEGTPIKLDVGQNIDSAVATKIVFVPPNSSAFVRNGGKDGNYITYSLSEGDIIESGVWSLQGWVDLGSWSGYTKPVEMRVYRRLLDVDS